MVLRESLLALTLFTLGASEGAPPPRPPQTSHGGIKVPLFPRPPLDTAEAAAARARSPSAIRGVDLRALIASPLGRVSTAEALYADLDGDGKEEVVVPIFAGPPQNDVAVVVLGFDAHGVLSTLLYREGRQLQATLKNGQLVITEPGPGDGGAAGVRRTSVYRWDGRALVEQPAP